MEDMDSLSKTRLDSLFTALTAAGAKIVQLKRIRNGASAFKGQIQMTKELFQEFDADGNGSLDSMEFRAIAHRLGRSMEPSEADEVMKESGPLTDGKFFLRPRGDDFKGEFVICVVFRGKPTHHLMKKEAN